MNIIYKYIGNDDDLPLSILALENFSELYLLLYLTHHDYIYSDIF